MCSLETIAQRHWNKTLNHIYIIIYTEYYGVYLTTVLRDETENDLFTIEMKKIPRRRKFAAIFSVVIHDNIAVIIQKTNDL